MKVEFEGGMNIAVKIPRCKYEATVAFYRDTLKFKVVEESIDNPTVSRTNKVIFGSNVLWLDCVENYTHAEIWLEVKTDNVGNAVRHLKSKGTNTVDELEKIPDSMHWIMDPAGTVLLLTER